ncbi:dihydrodipicolinate reductase [Roseibium sp. TrichSKD4]|uniref:4-hydroxy-tetrahydrodipicolinate reductase n=1 Tax=Roseibium sp. TrichSKD4 TaxID=744980 RepID=UPI0001E56687|nr:4-hydroxy-tetrahydrodipicolinate reductase [Roseibium sp. TrichSKD4]EFO32766.1 dihydrodipicolinate reductase [Roseibium sp. TrichSKD4]
MGDMRIAVVGAAGRMGKALIQAVWSTPGVCLSGGVEREGSHALGQDLGEIAGVGHLGIPISDDPLTVFANTDGVLDFTAPQASLAFAELAAQARIAHIIGTTGWTEGQDEPLKAAARHARIVKSGNMSLGVNLLANLVRKAAAALDTDFDIEVLEMHHRHKVDAPSGTALLLGEAAAEGRTINLEEKSVRVRDGITGAREEGTIGFATLRGGSVIGEHSVIFAADGERIELAHKAEDRSLFAKGAVKAALWAFDKKPGYYSMADVLGLSD